jgi:hypothetical protein
MNMIIASPDEWELALEELLDEVAVTTKMGHQGYAAANIVAQGIRECQ